MKSAMKGSALNAKTLKIAKKAAIASQSQKKVKVQKDLVIKKKGESVKNGLDSVRCGIKPFRGSIDADIDDAAIQNYVSAIIGQINDKTGQVPVAGGDLCDATVYFYIQLCLLAYLERAGVLSGGSDLVVEYAKYYIPCWLANLFQHCAPWTDENSTASVTLNPVGFTYAYVAAQSQTEGFLSEGVVVSYSATYNNEPIFGFGTTVSIGSYTQVNWANLSQIMNTSIPSICVADIPIRAPSCEGIVGYFVDTYGTYYETLKPCPAVSSVCSLFKIRGQHIGPHRMAPPVVWGLINGAHSDGDMHIRQLFAYYGKKLGDIRNEKISRVWSANCGDPYRISVDLHQVNYSKLVGLMWDWLKRSGMGNSFAVSDASRFNTLQAYWWAALMARAPSVTKTVFLGYRTMYTTPSLKMASLPPCVALHGFKPTRSKGAIYLPQFGAASLSLMTFFQSTVVFATPSYSPQPGKLPIIYTVPSGVTFAGLTPVATTTRLNLTPLTLIEEIEAFLAASSANHGAQTIPYPTDSEACPCTLR